MTHCWGARSTSSTGEMRWATQAKSCAKMPLCGQCQTYHAQTPRRSPADGGRTAAPLQSEQVHDVRHVRSCVRLSLRPCRTQVCWCCHAGAPLIGSTAFAAIEQHTTRSLRIARPAVQCMTTKGKTLPRHLHASTSSYCCRSHDRSKPPEVSVNDVCKHREIPAATSFS